jgi:hypothetical protein
LNRIVFERVPLGQSSEAAWAMWLMKQLAISLADKSEHAINASEDSAVALMALGLASVGLANPASLVGLHRFSDSSNLFQNQWLLCYQGNYMAWLGPGSGRAVLRADPAMAYLESQDVTFFDITVPAPTPIRGGVIYGDTGGY